MTDIPAAELLAHKMRAAWPKTGLIGLTDHQADKVATSKAIFKAQDKLEAEFTGDQPPWDSGVTGEPPF